VKTLGAEATRGRYPETLTRVDRSVVDVEPIRRLGQAALGQTPLRQTTMGSRQEASGERS
jgi:hypothetical protein